MMPADDLLSAAKTYYIYTHMSLYLREKGGGWSDLFVIFRCSERRGSEVKGKGCI
jgi:hypothetical protein